jgi:hypothetical protein
MMDLEKALEQAKSVFVANPRSKEGLIAVTTWFVMLIYVLYLHLFVVQLGRESANYLLYALVLIIPLIGTFLFAGDSLAFGSSAEAKFFQKEFPDKHVAKKFGVEEAEARRLWFRALDRRLDDQLVKRTYQYGYTCRLFYYAKRAVFWFALLTSVTLAGTIMYRLCKVIPLNVVGQDRVWEAVKGEANLLGKVVYLVHLVGLFLFLKFSNRIDPRRPTGVWKRWREVNERNRKWVDQFTDLAALRLFADGDSLRSSLNSKNARE